MKVYLVTEKTEFSEDMQLIFESYEDAKAYVHDEIKKIVSFVEEHPVPIEIDSESETLQTYFEEPILNKKYLGMAYAKREYGGRDFPIAMIEVSARNVMSFVDGELKTATTGHARRPRYVSYSAYLSDKENK